MPHHLLHHLPHRLPCAAGEEEEVDECVLGMVERPPPSLRPPGAGVVQAFRSDRQKTETASPDAGPFDADVGVGRQPGAALAIEAMELQGPIHGLRPGGQLPFGLVARTPCGQD